MVFESKKATYCSAGLNVISPHWLSVVHRVESGDLVNPHRGHLQLSRHLVHDADACPAVLPLTEVEKRHHGCFFVLRRVAGEDLFDKGFILGVEFEGDGWVVVGCVAVLLRG